MARAKNNGDVYNHYKGVEYSMDKDGYLEIVTSGSDLILDPGEVEHIFRFLEIYKERWENNDKKGY